MKTKNKTEVKALKAAVALGHRIAHAEIKAGRIVDEGWLAKQVMDGQPGITEALAQAAVKRVFDDYEPRGTAAELLAHAAELRRYVASRQRQRTMKPKNETQFDALYSGLEKLAQVQEKKRCTLLKAYQLQPGTVMIRADTYLILSENLRIRADHAKASHTRRHLAFMASKKG